MANAYDNQIFKDHDVESRHEHQPSSSSSLASEKCDFESNPTTPSSRLVSWSTMRSKFILIVLSAAISWHLLFTLGAYAVPGVRKFDKSLNVTTVDEFSSFEYPVALAGLYANIGPSGSQAQGAAAGVVIASPSTSNPNYLYSWIRDSSLVYKYIIDRYVSGRDTTLLNSINTWISSMAIIQQVSNPSGTVSTGGLGEPKFLISEQAFTGPWGRPQRDGPALRSTSIITLANYLIAQNNSTYVKNTLWPILLLDLNYVANNWNETGFDLWEELDGASFFTTAVQHRALREGITLASTLGDPSGTVAAWTTQANSIYCFLQSYWSSSSGYIVANVKPGSGAVRSGIDSNTIITSIHTFDPSAGCDSTTYQPCSDKALANLKVYVDSFRSIYSVNSGIASNAGVATGRYPEDIYYNGNPWYLTTFAVSEQLYRALQVWDTLGEGINVTPISLAFFQQFSSAQSVGTIPAGSSAYTSMTNAILTYADEFALMGAKYTPGSGALSEQYSKTDGTPTSAIDLTWSYASVLTMFDARSGTAAESWGAAGLNPSSLCPGGGTSTVTFDVTATTVLGENIYLSGSISPLSDWSTSSALGPLDNTNTYPVWTISVPIPANTTFQYKYIRKYNGGVTWESDPNRSATSPAAGATLVLTDTWR